MKRRALQWAARLYPADWRRRYGTEFEALLEQSTGAAAVADVLKGALAMRVKSWSVWKLAAVCGVAGALIAGAANWSAPKQYTSTAVLKVTSDAAVEDEKAAIANRIKQIRQTALSSASLRAPIETYDIGRDLVVRPVQGTAPNLYAISYTAGSPAQAQRVSQALVARFIQANRDAGGAGATFKVFDAGSLPVQPLSAGLWQWILAGLLVGSSLTLVAAGALRWPIVAAAGVAGAVAAIAICLALPRDFASTAVVRGDAAKNAPTLLSDATLFRLIQNPELDLYPSKRVKMPLPEVAARMRRNISIRNLRPYTGQAVTQPAITIAFAYPNRRKAQAVTRQLVAQLTGVEVVALSTASYPDKLMRLRVALWGLTGLALGLLSVWR